MKYNHTYGYTSFTVREELNAIPVLDSITKDTREHDLAEKVKFITIASQAPFELSKTSGLPKVLTEKFVC